MEKWYQCNECARVDAVRLQCNHMYCRECLEMAARRKTLNKKFEAFECPTCDKEIEAEHLLKFFYVNNEEFLNTVESYRVCVFCNDELNNAVDLICRHRSCKFCILKCLGELDHENNHFTKLSCKKCNTFIAPIVYQSFASQELIRRLINSPAKASKLRVICEFCKKFGDSDENFIFRCEKCRCGYCCLCMKPHKQICRNFGPEVNNNPNIQKQIPIIKPKPLVSSSQKKIEIIRKESKDQLDQKTYVFPTAISDILPQKRRLEVNSDEQVEQAKQKKNIGGKKQGEVYFEKDQIFSAIPHKKGPSNKQNDLGLHLIKPLEPTGKPPVAKLGQFLNLSDLVCNVCKTNQGLSIGCSHLYCKSCLLLYIKKVLSENPLESIKCHCGLIIPEQLIIESFGGRAVYLNAKERATDFLFGINDATFACGICMIRFTVSESITLDCDHRFCGQCMQDYFKERIMSSNVSEDNFTCPECGKPVEHTTIQGVVGKDLFEKYITFAFRNWKPEAGNIVKVCHKCENIIEIPIDLKRMRCYFCKAEYCPQCNNDHQPQITCDQFEELKAIEENKKKKRNQKKLKIEEKPLDKNYEKRYEKKDKIKPKKIEEQKKHKSEEDKKQKIKKDKQRAEKALKIEKIDNDLNKRLNEEKQNLDFIAKNFKKCPQCKTPVEKESGCNFMKCRWPGCKDSYFCLLCDKALTVIDMQISDHYTHYKLSGPYGKTCNTKDGIR